MGRLGDDITRLRREIADLQENRETLVGELKANRSRIQRNVGRMQDRFREQRQVQAENLRQDLDAFRRKITQDVSDLREANAQWRTRMPDLKGSWARMREEIHRNLAQTSRQGAKDRASYVSGIRRYLNGLQEEFTAYRNMVSQDLDGLRRAWHGARDVEHGSFAADPHGEEKTVTIEDAEVPDTNDGDEMVHGDVPQNSSGEASFSMSDDLTMITGIAQERQHQLNAVGIATFEELSARSAKEVQVMLGKPISRSEIQRWIDQARELTLFNPT